MKEYITIFDQYEYKGTSLPFILIYPKNIDVKNKYPLVLFYHGAGERSSQNGLQLKIGPASTILSEEFQNRQETFFLAPLCPKDTGWNCKNVEDKDRYSNLSLPIRPILEASWNLLKDIVSKYPIDEKNVSVTGLSMGGGATLEIIGRHPGYFRRAVAVCPANVFVDDAKAFKDENIYLTQGLSDTIVYPCHSIDFVKSLEKEGIEIKHRYFEGVDHDCWTLTYNSKEFIDFMLK